MQKRKKEKVYLQHTWNHLDYIIKVHNNKEFERIAYIKYNLYFMQNKNILGT